MVKILSKSGDSLADQYDVEGSVAGIEQLVSREVSLTHDMAATLFSERFSTFIRATSTAAIGQSADFAAVMASLPNVPTRLLAIAVTTDFTGRLTRACVNLRDPTTPREIPIWVFDATLGELNIEIDAGTGQETLFLLPALAQQTMLPSFCGGAGQRTQTGSEEIALRGRTSAFGAGDVTITLLALLAFSEIGGVSSRGVQIPGW